MREVVVWFLASVAYAVADNRLIFWLDRRKNLGLVLAVVIVTFLVGNLICLGMLAGAILSGVKQVFLF